MSKPYSVDWTRERILPVTGNSNHCLHGSRLTEWCGDCRAEIEQLAADMGGCDR